MKVSQEQSLSDRDCASQARTDPSPTFRPPLSTDAGWKLPFSSTLVQCYRATAMPPLLPSMAVVTNQHYQSKYRCFSIYYSALTPAQKKSIGGKYKMHLICLTPVSQQCQLAHVITNWELQFTQENQTRAHLHPQGDLKVKTLIVGLRIKQCRVLA